MIWQGWLLSVRPLITGADEAAAKASTSSCLLARIITRSTMRARTLAVSSMVSPRPSCMSLEVAMVEAPPSWRMAASNEKRVRVEFFWKIIARVRPAAGASGSSLPLGQPARACLRRRASSMMPRRARASSRHRSMKCRVVISQPSAWPAPPRRRLRTWPGLRWPPAWS